MTTTCSYRETKLADSVVVQPPERQGNVPTASTSVLWAAFGFVILINPCWFVFVPSCSSRKSCFLFSLSIKDLCSPHKPATVGCSLFCEDKPRGKAMRTEPWVSLEGISQHLGVSQDTIHRWIQPEYASPPDWAAVEVQGVGSRSG